MTSAFDSFDASPLGARLQSAVDGSGAFGGVGGIIVAGAASQRAIKQYSGGGPSFWEIFGRILVWGALAGRATDLRGALISSAGTYTWAGIPLLSSTPSTTIWEETVGFTIRRVTRNISSSVNTADEWNFYAFGRIVDGDPPFTTTQFNFQYEAAIRSVSATPADNTFTVQISTDSVSTIGTVDVATTADQLVTDLNASGAPQIASVTWSLPTSAAFIDDGDGVIWGTVDAVTITKVITLTVSGTGSGTVETAPFTRFYDVTRNVLWSL